MSYLAAVEKEADRRKKIYNLLPELFKEFEIVKLKDENNILDHLGLVINKIKEAVRD